MRYLKKEFYAGLTSSVSLLIRVLLSEQFVAVLSSDEMLEHIWTSITNDVWAHSPRQLVWDIIYIKLPHSLAGQIGSPWYLYFFHTIQIS